MAQQQAEKSAISGMKGEQFVHLRLHSSYSLLESSLRIEAIVNHAEKAEMPAVALTDRGNLYGALEFASAMAARGIQPIIGCSLPILTDRARKENRVRRHPVLALLARSEAGYRNLMQLSRLAHTPERLNETKGEPHVRLAEVRDLAEGLICLTGGADGLIVNALAEERTHHGPAGEAARLFDRLQEFFPDHLYVELQRHGLENERLAEEWLLREADSRKLALVATHDPYFATPDDFAAQDTLVCVGQGKMLEDPNRRRLTEEHWFKSGADMAALFSDMPHALANSGRIARLCHFYPQESAPELPRFGDTPQAEAGQLRQLAEKGLAQRLAVIEKAAPEGEYHERLAHELKIITDMAFSGYFLIVADFVQWAKGQGIPVGPGRGSGAGSLVAYALGITDLDPIRFGLFFERFLNPGRISMPDFDIDFCQERRDEVIAHVRQRYGDERVANIITFGSLHARAAMRDAGRVLGLSYTRVDGLCKLVPNDPANPIKLAEAVKREPALQKARDEDEAVATLLETSSALEGLYRHASTHAAGVVIGAGPLEEKVPLTYDPRSGTMMTQFSMKWVEKAGLVKFDFLGLKTLTALRLTMELLRESGTDIKLESIPLDDPKIYELLSSGETSGLFQLESGGVRDALKQMQPDRFEDIIALVALYRPGPMANIPRYIRRKKGQEQPDYLHPSLEETLKETFGVIIYQEQVMQIAQILADFTPAEADILRRAMGKKIPAEMRAQKQRFVEGAAKKDIARAKATEIFDLVDRFAGYGFNKSHAAAYALLAVQSAWLKAHHPVEFLAAQMTLDHGRPEDLNQLKQEAGRLGVRIAPPDINRSNGLFSVDKGEILYALGAVRNVGRGTAAAIVAARKEGGAFKSLDDFAARISPRHMNKQVFEYLAMVGAFDSIEKNRRIIVDHAEGILRTGGRVQQQADMGQEALFAGDAGLPPALPEGEAWSKEEALEQEFRAAGLYLSGHPLEGFEKKLAKAGFRTAADLPSLQHGGKVWLAGVITAIHKRRSQKGNAYAFFSLSDPGGVCEVLVFSELLSMAMEKELAEKGKQIAVEVEAERQGEGEGELRLRALAILPLERGLAQNRGAEQKPKPVKPLAAKPNEPPKADAKEGVVRIFLNAPQGVAALKPHLCASGGMAVHVMVPGDSEGNLVEIALPACYVPSAEAAEKLTGLPGVSRVERLGSFA